MWTVKSRRKDSVVQERLARSMAQWLFGHSEVLDSTLTEAEIKRLLNLITRALASEDDHECWLRFTKYIKAVFTTPEQWSVVRQRFYAYRRTNVEPSDKARTIQIPQYIYQALIDSKPSDDTTFAAVIEDLLDIASQHKE